MYVPLNSIQSCHLCTFGHLDFIEHPCNVCEYDETTGENSQFRPVKTYEISDS